MDRRGQHLNCAERAVIFSEDLRGSSQRQIGGLLGRAASPRQRSVRWSGPLITALADLLRRHVPLGKSRLETMALLTVGMIGARTVNPGRMLPMSGGRARSIRPRPVAVCSGSSNTCGCPATGLRR